MACLKCGKKTKDEHVFCSACLSVMEAYPVKQDMHIQLPNHKERALPKRSNRKRRTLSPEEQVAALKKRQRRLIAAIALLLILLSTAVGLLVYSIVNPEDPTQNANNTTQHPTK